MTTSSPRKVRPGETPRFGSVWSWNFNGPKFLVLRLVPVIEASGIRLNLVGLQLLATPNRINDTMRWSQAALVGMGPVLDAWFCHDEGVTVD